MNIVKIYNTKDLEIQLNYNFNSTDLKESVINLINKFNSSLDNEHTRTVKAYGRQCSGKNKACYAPWYTRDSGLGLGLSKCVDKSDEIFQTGLTCWEHFEQNMEFHDAHFCNSSIPSNVYNQSICTNKFKFLLDFPINGLIMINQYLNFLLHN